MPGNYAVKVFETGVNQVPAGTQRGGWVSGNLAGLADGQATVVCFDLGDDWDQYTFVQLGVLSANTSSLTNVQMYSSDTPTNNGARRLKEVSTATSANALNTSFYTINTSSGVQQGTFRPMGRYFFIGATNTAGGGVQGAGAKITLAAYPQ